MKRFPELLAPAGSMESLEAALRCGADAVYLGAKQFSARAHAENFNSAGLAAAASRCHLYGAKLYLAVNTLLLDSEFEALDALLETAGEIGADGCIVQDFGAAVYISKRLPTMPLHVSTQMTIHTPAGLQFARQMGFTRAVLARELPEKQIAAISREAKHIGMETEVFVHGAHCMCVSGQCFLSAAMGGRSANRGCCAQPCRLPFTADSADPQACALSLKDQSLVQHLGRLCEIGVDSLKIEGRMKRPEYVAAAVTACRTALDHPGEQPDTEALRAVFSRSGFTDGYYTGVRSGMFGTRRKEDVTAAQDVLPKLRELYRKPRKCVDLDMIFKMQADEPVTLQVRDADGNRAEVSGDLPQKAHSRPADEMQLRRQFEKLGDTIYNMGGFHAELADGLMLPASACNALRRAACEMLDEIRISANTPQHRAGERPLPPPAVKNQKKLNFRVQIRSMKQLTAVRNFEQELEFLMLPLNLLPEYLQTGALFPKEKIMLVPPRFVCDENHLRGLLEQAKNNGFTHVCCQHAGDIRLGAELGLTLHGGFGLHAANAYAAAALRDFGLLDALRSPETAGHFAAALPLGVFAYGRLPLMLTRNCPIRNQTGCGKCRHQLTDRKGETVYTDCTRYTEKPDYAEIFNAVPVWLADRPKQLQNAAYALLFLTDESPERARAVLGAYLHGETAAKPQKFTRGLSLADHAR